LTSNWAARGESGEEGGDSLITIRGNIERGYEDNLGHNSPKLKYVLAAEPENLFRVPVILWEKKVWGM